VLQPAIHEIRKIPDFLKVAPIMLAGKVDLIVIMGALPHRSAMVLDIYWIYNENSWQPIVFNVVTVLA
jgi:hypothetical protein